jgi:hypothetical protein
MMSPKRKPSKPAGTTGHLPWGGGDGRFQRLALPRDGEERERFIVNAMFRDQHHGGPDLNTFYGISVDPQRNPDANAFPDFFLPQAGGLGYLEVTEFAPLELFGTYEDVPHVYERGSLADLARNAIMRKWNRYGETARGAALLMYSADWRLHMDTRTVELLRLALGREAHGFSSVAYYELLDDLGGQLYVIYPTQCLPALGFDEAVERRTIGVRANLTVPP